MWNVSKTKTVTYKGRQEIQRLEWIDTIGEKETKKGKGEEEEEEAKEAAKSRKKQEC